MSSDRYVFIVEWYDSAASLIRNYQFTFNPIDNSIEMVSPSVTQFDLKNKKIFLKRTEYKAIGFADLYIGAIITVYSRKLKIVDYADVFTRKKFESKKSKTLAMIKPDAYLQLGKIISMVEQAGFIISNLKLAKMSPSDAEEFYAEHRGKPFYENLVGFMSSDYVVAMELVSDECIAKWRSLIGPTNCHVARAESPNSIRALFGTDGTKNAVHGSDSPGSAQREIDFFFSEKSKLKTTAILNNCTCGIIKPHILSQGNAGRILDSVLSEGFEISALQMFYLDRPTSEEFLEVYKGVLPEYPSLSEHLTTGPCIAIEVRQENAVNAFRELCGPHDPELAKTLRPRTIRAQFGIDRVRNAIHCTDLPEDGVLECEYFFTILQK